MSPGLAPSSAIIIVGGGTWAISTSLQLARRGYNNVTILDLYPVPSPISAGNDVNKIMEQGKSRFDKSFRYRTDNTIGSLTDVADENDDVTQELLDLAHKAWTEDPVYKPYYHETGYIVAANTPEGIAHLHKREQPDKKAGFQNLNSAEDFRNTMPKGVLTGTFPSWKGVYKSTGAGWVHARKALVSAAKEAESCGVKFITGSPQGQVTSLLYKDKDVIGAKTADGIEHIADHTILAAGAGSNELFDFKDQLRPTAWTLCHMQMTQEETNLYKNLPVLFNIEKGFFMEPDEDRHELKICDEHPGYCNMIKGPDGKLKSMPFAKHQIPKEAEMRTREFLQETMPQLAERPLSFARICWDADTPDRNFLIDSPPESPSLTVAVGASGHGFMHMPSIGGIIVDALENRLDPKLRRAFRWRPETAVNRDWNHTQDRFGGPNRIMDFNDVTEWTNLPARL